LKVAVVDYEMGNIFSIKQACEYVGLTPVITNKSSVIMDSDSLILPGVGAFGDAVYNLKKYDLINPIKDFIIQGRPFMGICLGMQLLLTESEEFGAYQGLNIIEGRVVKILNSNEDGKKKIKVPHVGWNQICIPPDDNNDFWLHTPLKCIRNGEFMYFAHSYYCVPASQDIVLSTTDYEGITFCSGIVRNNLYAFQFHPEKSGANGLKIYENFAHLINKTGAFC